MSVAIQSTPNPSKTTPRLSLLTAVVASQAYQIICRFLRPRSHTRRCLCDRPHTHLHLVSGQIGNVEEVFHWDGLVQTMLLSVLVFVAGWMAARGTAKLLASSGSASYIQTNRYQLAQAITASDISTASTGGIV